MNFRKVPQTLMPMPCSLLAKVSPLYSALSLGIFGYTLALRVTKKVPLPVPNEFEWLTAAEAAQHLKMKPRTLLLLGSAGRLKAYKLSGTKRHVWRFQRAE